MSDAHRLAQQLVAEHSLRPLDVDFVFTSNFLGRCLYDEAFQPTRIELSHPWVQRIDEAEFRDLLLHEIAHANAGYDAAHGPDWELEAVRLGVFPDPVQEIDPAVHLGMVMASFRYTAVCENPSCEFPQQFFFHTLKGRLKHKGRRCKACRHRMRILDQHANPEEAATLIGEPEPEPTLA